MASYLKGETPVVSMRQIVLAQVSIYLQAGAAFRGGCGMQADMLCTSQLQLESQLQQCFSQLQSEQQKGAHAMHASDAALRTSEDKIAQMSQSSDPSPCTACTAFNHTL